MATEIEIKLKAPDRETLDAALSSAELTPFLRDQFETTHMRSTYYDTPNGELRTRRWTLRLREEGSRRIAAMKTVSEKTPDGMFTRGEWQCACDSIAEAIGQLVEQGAPPELGGLARDGLIETCVAEFDRRSAYLYLPDGVVVEMAGDTGTLEAGGRREPILELEMELLFGSASVLVPLAEQLTEEYPLVPETRSKYERALALLDEAHAPETTP